MISLTFGNYRKVKHVLYPPKPGESVRNELCEDVQQWCNGNLHGCVEVDWETFERFSEEDQQVRTYGHFVFSFENERDAILFKLFHFGG